MAGSNIKFEKSMLLLVIVFIIIITTSVIVVSALQTNPVEDIIASGEPIKILFVLEDQGNVLFTDIFVYYPVLARGALFDIPGNTSDIFSSINRVDRIDAIFREKGVDAYRSEIEKLVDQTIPFSIVCSVEDFRLLTDMLGGLKVFVSHPVDNLDSEGVRWLLPSGMVNLDGEKIYTYLYYYSPEDTVDSIKDRFQSVMIAFLSALNRNKSVIFEENNFAQYAKYLSSNIEKKHLEILLETVADVDSERLVLRSVEGSYKVIDGKTLLQPMDDGKVVKDLFKRTLASLASESETMYDRTYVLEVQNGTTVQGLARNTSIFFQGHGYDVVASVNADSNDYEETVIIDHIGNQEVANVLGSLILCDNIVTAEILPETAGMDTVSVADFTIILGKDFDGRYVR